MHTAPASELHIRNEFLFVINRDYDSIACFAVDPVTGRLKLKGIVPTEVQSHELALDPDDTFLLVTGYESGRVAIYHVLDDGKLRQLDSRPVGRKPKGVLVARQDNSP